MNNSKLSINNANIYNTNNSNIYSTTKSSKILKEKSTLNTSKKTLNTSKKLSNSKNINSNVDSPNKILNKKIKLSIIKNMYADKTEFIEFIDKLSLVTKSITYFDFFQYHFIFTINVPSFL
jgi:hypothetical protein